MRIKSDLINIALILGFLLLLNGCDFSKEHLSKIRKDTDVETLVAELTKDSLYKTFEGFTITPRSWYHNVFLFFREEEPKIFYWLTYDSRGVDFFKIEKNEIEGNTKLIMEYDSSNYLQLERDYLQKAYELISIMKELNIRSAIGDRWHFSFSFNDSSNLTYIKEPDKLDTTFFRLYKNVKWLDSNFVTYDYRD